MAFETSTSTAPGSTSPANPNSGGGFSPSGSPPIIVAFLSVGLFVAGMLSIRFWRLNRMTRGFGQRHHDPGAVAEWRDVGEKPVLWNMYPDGAKNEAAGWKDIMPLSVTVSDLGMPASDQFRPAALRYCDALRTRFHVQKEMEMNIAPLAEPRTRLQVAVPIALPSRRRAMDAASEKTTGMGGGSGVEYSIGLFDVLMQVDSGTSSHDGII